MLLTKLSAHPEHPGQGWLQMYPAALHNPRAQKPGQGSNKPQLSCMEGKIVIFIEDNCIEQQ